MAPIKFEEHVKEKLDAREIQPSVKSWDTLNSRLDTSSKKSGRKWWMSAVAAVMVLLVASLIFVKQQDVTQVPIVERPVEKGLERSGVDTFEQPVQLASEEIKPQETQEIATNIKPVKVEEPKQKSANPTPVVILTPVVEKMAAEIIIPDSEFLEVKPDEMNMKVQELLAKVAEKEKQNGRISDLEVNALLAQAVTEIGQERVLESLDRIDANSLLADVENDLDQSFRKEVFEMLKENFLKAKTALVTRND